MVWGRKKKAKDEELPVVEEDDVDDNVSADEDVSDKKKKKKKKKKAAEEGNSNDDDADNSGKKKKKKKKGKSAAEAEDDPNAPRNYAPEPDIVIDEEFPPTLESLGPDKRWKALEWHRPMQFARNPVIFDHDIVPSDITQGALGDCYFLSALSALAETPERIRNIFVTKDGLNDNDRYVVRFFKNGMWVNVEIDDYFPCMDLRGPVFSRAKTGELWVLIIEKAYAKLHGSYYNIAKGDSGEALTDLTGAPSERLQISIYDDDELWELIKRWDKRNYVMAASVPDVPGDKHAEVGLIEDHSYALVKVMRASATERLICLRNPWGKTEWTGDWSDNSPKWTPELKKKFGWSDADDGSFWMNLRDFRKYFTGMQVLYITDGWQSQSLELSFQNGFTQLVELTVHKKTDSFFGVFQHDRRMMRDPVYSYHAVQFKIVEPNPYRQVAVSKYVRDRQVFVDTNVLPKGKYLIEVMCDNTRSQRDVVLYCYSDRRVTMKPFRREVDRIDVFAAGLRTATRMWGKRSDYASGGGSHIYKYVFKSNEGVCILIRNREVNKLLVESLTFRMKNLAIVGAPKNTKTVALNVGPGGEEFIVLRKVGTMGFGYGCSSKFSVEDVSSESVSEDESFEYDSIDEFGF